MNMLIAPPDEQQDEPMPYAGQNVKAPEIIPADELVLGNDAGGVQWLGEVLDKGGSAVRGLLGGQGVNALANLIPFSDTMGLTNAPEGSTSVFGTEPLTNERVSGTDLLQKAGILGPADHEGFEWDNPNDWGRAAAGFATEVATDPLSLIGGPLSKGAKGIAEGGSKLIAHTPVTFSAALRSGELPLASIHAPFWAQWLGASKEPLAELSAKSGVVGQKLANAAASVNNSIAYSPLSPVRYLRGLLSPAASGDLTPSGSKYLIGVGKAARDQQILNDLAYSTRKTMTADWEDSAVGLMKTKRELASQFEDIAKHHVGNGDPVGAAAFDDYYRQLVSGKNGLPDLAAMQGDLQTLLKAPVSDMDAIVGLSERMHGALTQTREVMDAAHARLNALGLPVGTLDDLYAAHWYRGAKDVAAQNQLLRHTNRSLGISDVLVRPDIARENALRNVPGSDPIINRLAKHPAIAGFTTEDGAYRQLTPAEHLDALKAEATHRGIQFDKDVDVDTLRGLVTQDEIRPHLDAAWPDKTPVTRDAVTGDVQTGDLRTAGGNEHTYASESAKWLGTPKEPVGKGTQDLLAHIDAMSPQATRDTLAAQMKGQSKVVRDALQAKIDGIGGGIWEHGVYGKNVFEDASDYLKFMADRESTMRSAHNFLAQPGMVDTGEKVKDWASLKSVWEGTKYHSKPLDSAGLETFVRNNGKTLKVPEDVLADVAGGDKIKAFVNELKVAPGAEGALAAYTATAEPRVQNALTKLIDRVNQVYKTTLYHLWLPSHLRDTGSDIWQAASHGKAPLANFKQGDGGILGGIRRAVDYISNGKPSDRINEFVDSGILKNFSAIDIGGNATGVASRMTHMPEAGSGFWGSLKVAKERRSYNPFNLAGMPGMGPAEVAAGKSSFIASEFFQNFQNVKSFVSQYGYFDALRNQGYTVGQAKHLVERAFFTGSEGTKFARDIAQRAIPFWRFSAHNIPYQFAKLFEEPGGITAQTIRAMADSASGENKSIYTPGFLRENQAVAIGNNPAAQSFFTNSILPLNDLNDIVFRNGLPTSRSLEKPLGRLQPLALAPLEGYADRQVRTGRKLSDLTTPSGVPILDTLMANPTIRTAVHYSPASRAVGELYSMADPRKSWGQAMTNALGYGNVSTYNTESAKLRDIKNAYGAELSANPDVVPYTDYFLPDTKRANMSQSKQATIDFQTHRRAALTKAQKAYRARAAVQ
jgi:hypothetical protein